MRGLQTFAESASYGGIVAVNYHCYSGSFIYRELSRKGEGMTETLYSWVESLVCYYILLSAVTNFLPDNSFKKYIQYYLGLLLILVMLSPVFQVTGIQKEIDRCVEEMEENLQDREAWEEKAESFEENWQTVIQGQEVEP